MAEETGVRLLLRIEEAAKRLGVGRSTMYQMIQGGSVPVVRIGKSIRIKPGDLEAWVLGQASEDHVPGGRG
jgi:excisionase family DNA binding protein